MKISQMCPNLPVISCEDVAGGDFLDFFGGISGCGGGVWTPFQTSGEGIQGSPKNHSFSKGTEGFWKTRVS